MTVWLGNPFEASRSNDCNFRRTLRCFMYVIVPGAFSMIRLGPDVLLLHPPLPAQFDFCLIVKFILNLKLNVSKTF